MFNGSILHYAAIFHQGRKLSTENLAGKGSPTTGPVRASSLEDISTFTSHAPPLTSAGGQRIVDAVVKLYVPDHTYKYLDMSPVRQSYTVLLLYCTVTVLLLLLYCTVTVLYTVTVLLLYCYCTVTILYYILLLYCYCTVTILYYTVTVLYYYTILLLYTLIVLYFIVYCIVVHGAPISKRCVPTIISFHVNVIQTSTYVLEYKTCSFYTHTYILHIYTQCT